MTATPDPDRDTRLWAMTPDQRRAAARRGELSFEELRRWTARAPQEVDLIGGEFFWIAALDPNFCE